MAKTPTEQIRELTTDVRVLEAGNGSLREQVAHLKNTDAQQQGEIAALRNENTDLRRELGETRVELAVLRQQLQDHIKRADLADSRRWGLIILALGAIFSLATGLIVTLARK